MEKTCCVTGHRDIPEDKRAYVETELKKEVLSAIEDGYTRFISGFAEGADLIFAAIVAELKTQGRSLFLEAAIPHAGRLKNKNPLFQKLITTCDDVKILCGSYSRGSYFARNRYMVDESSRVIAVYNGQENGGTFFTIQYARKQGRTLRIIRI